MNKPDDPRAHYMALAARAFADAGFHGVSLAALAREAGVSKQAILHFFGTKERLYAAVLSDLAARLCAEVEAAADPDPTRHLLRYFQTFRTRAMAEPADVRLVVRALLDSDEGARLWPMKPYLDRLTDVAARTPGGVRASRAEILGWLSQVVAMIEYPAISAPAMRGMFGRETAEAMAAALEGRLARAILDFAGAPSVARN